MNYTLSGNNVHQVAKATLADGQPVHLQIRANFTPPSNENNQTAIVHSWGYDFTNAKRQRVSAAGFATIAAAAEAGLAQAQAQGWLLFRR